MLHVHADTDQQPDRDPYPDAHGQSDLNAHLFPDAQPNGINDADSFPHGHANGLAHP